MLPDEEGDDLTQDFRSGRSVEHTLDLEETKEIEIEADDLLTEDDLAEEEEEAETVEAAAPKKTGRRKTKPEDKPFSDYDAGVRGDDDWGAEAAGEGEVNSSIGRNSGPLEGEDVERQVQAIDAKRRTHRQPTGHPPPTREIVRRRKSSTLAKGGGARAKARAKGKGKKTA